MGFLILHYIFLNLINHILTEKILNNFRKLNLIQIIDIKATSGTKVKVINSDYVPNRVYINGDIGTIDSSGYVKLELSGINDVRLEWDKPKTKYTKLFRNVESIIEVTFTNFDTSEVTSIAGMFNNCKNLKYINFKNMNTSLIYDMSNMFENCSSLLSLDLSNFETSTVSLVENMFKNCSSLKSLNLSSFKTPNLWKVNDMFYGCSSLVNIDLSNLETTLTSNMSNMFYGCSSLISLNITNFRTPFLEYMNGMFMKCKSLKSIDLSQIDTSRVKNMSSMFYECSSLSFLDLSNFKTSKVEYMDYMFYKCNSLTSINLSGFETNEVLSMESMFSSCESLISIDLSNFDISQKNIKNLFYNCKNLKSIKFSQNYMLVENIDRMFYNCFSLKSLDLSSLDFGAVDNMESLFYGCSSLTSLDLSYIDAFSVTNMANMFHTCYSLKILNLSNMITSLVTNLDSMFFECKSLISLDLTSFDTYMVTNMKDTFNNCINLKSLNLSNFDTSLVTNMKSMFYSCKSLTTIDLSNFNTTLVTDMSNMFYGCNNLTFINLSNFNIDNVNTVSNIFSDCVNLEYINIKNFANGNISDFSKMFNGIINNIIICIDLNNKYDIDNILLEINSKKCPVIDCSLNWENNRKKIIDEKDICIDNCNDDEIYKYEFKYHCYEKCPKGTHSIKDNIYSCEENMKDCVANYPFINRKDNSCLEECLSKDFFNNVCGINNFKNYKNSLFTLISNIIQEIQDGTLDELLINKEYDIIKLENDTLFQITNSFNQYNKEYINISTIKLESCEKILKKENNITNDDYSLIIFKIDKFIDNISIPLIEYEIFNPVTKKKLTLESCINKNKTILINIPISINENNLIKYNPKSYYYNNICKPYTTEYGTDISLYDRKSEFNKYYSICPRNCLYNEYNSLNKEVICNCTVIEGISFNLIINKNELIYKFSKIKHSINISLLKCLKTLFSKEGLAKNIGSYILLVIIIFCIILTLIFQFKEFNKISHQINDLLIFKLSEKNNEIFKEELKENSTDYVSDSKKSKVSEIKNRNSNKSNLNKKYSTENSVNYNVLKNKHKQSSDRSEMIKTTTNYMEYEINIISYNEAFENDKRTYWQFYISLIKTKHILVFTFNKINDYNSFVIKIYLLFFYIALYLPVNTLFFNDSLIHRIYIDKGKFNIIYIIPQIFYSIIICSILFSILRRLSLTQSNILKIKQEKDKNNLNTRVTIVLRQIKIKFKIFFIICFALLLMFWYYVSSFCAIYKNTQIYLIKTTLISLILSFIYPLFIYLLPGLFRFCSFKQPGECLYKTSQIIQIF